MPIPWKYAAICHNPSYTQLRHLLPRQQRFRSLRLHPPTLLQYRGFICLFENKSASSIAIRCRYSSVPQGLLTPKTMELLSAVHEHRGKQALYLAAKPDALEALTKVARVQSTEASNRIATPSPRVPWAGMRAATMLGRSYAPCWA